MSRPRYVRPRLRSIAMTGAFLISSAIWTPTIAQVNHEFTVEGQAGIEYDDNITVTEIDAETNEDDFAAVIELGAEWDAEFSESDSLSLGYNFSHNEQFDLSAFDLQIHGTNITYEHEFGDVSAGLMHQYFFTRLGGDGLLGMHRVTPYVTAFPNRYVFLRAAYTYKDKNLKNRIARDAKTHMGEVSAFFFVDGTDTFLSAGYRFEDEDAIGPAFDFQAHILRAGIDTRLPVEPDENRFEVDLEYEARNYDNVTPSIGEIRDDDRLTLDVSWEVPLNDILFIEAAYRFRDFSSNLPSSNFTENVVSLVLGFEF